MKSRSYLVAGALTLCGLTLWAGSTGIRPRPNASDYADSDQSPAATFAASALSPKQVQNGFATDLNNGYIVVEVAVYPSGKSPLQLSPDDFLLKVGHDASADLVRPASPATIASVIQRKNTPKSPSKSDVVVYPTASVGYESGTDPYTGRRVHGWDTAVGAGVGVGGPGGPPPPASTNQDRRTMEGELTDKGLPEGDVKTPVAGYLYFPAPKSKKAAGNYELQYMGDASQVRLIVPVPAK